MRLIEVAPAARADLEQIGIYTREKWGNRQMGRYLSQFAQRFDWLAQNPAAGHPREDLAPGLRSFRQGSHIVFYRRTGRGIAIARVIHTAMDIDDADF